MDCYFTNNVLNDVKNLLMQLFCKLYGNSIESWQSREEGESLRTRGSKEREIQIQETMIHESFNLNEV